MRDSPTVAPRGSGLPVLRGLADACPAGASGERRAHCEAVATLLARDDATALGTSAAVMVGKHVGWPAERLAALEAQHAGALALAPLRAVRAPWTVTLPTCPPPKDAAPAAGGRAAAPAPVSPR